MKKSTTAQEGLYMIVIAIGRELEKIYYLSQTRNCVNSH